MAETLEDQTAGQEATHEPADMYAGLGREDEPKTRIEDVNKAEAMAHASDLPESHLVEHKKAAEVRLDQAAASTNAWGQGTNLNMAKVEMMKAEDSRISADIDAKVAAEQYDKQQAAREELKKIK